MSGQTYNMEVNLSDGTKQIIPADNVTDVRFVALSADQNENILTPEYIPDDLLRAAISEQVASNSDFLSMSEAANYAGDLRIDTKVKDMKGIELFSSLTFLYMYNTDVEELDLTSLQGLTDIFMEFNQSLVKLDISGLDNLRHVDVAYSYSLATENGFDLSKAPSGITRLSIIQDGFMSLDLSALSNLQTLICSGNNLTGIDLSASESLIYLDCTSNMLGSVDASKCPNLETLLAGSNKNLKSVNVEGCGNLKEISLMNTMVSAFDAQPVKNTLLNLSLQNTRVEVINVEGCKVLEKLELGNTKVRGDLDLRTCPNIYHLRVEGTNLRSFDLSNSTTLKELQAFGMPELESVKLASYLSNLFQVNIYRNPKLASFQWDIVDGIGSAFDMAGEGGVERIDISHVNPDGVSQMWLENSNLKEIKVWPDFDMDNVPLWLSVSPNAKFVYEFTE